MERGKKQIKNPTQTEPVYKSRPQRSYDDENNFDDDLFERLKPKPRVTKDDIILKEKAEMLVSESDDFFEETINPEPPEKSKNHQFGFRRIEPKKTPSQRAEARTNAPKFETKNEPRQKPQPQEQNSKFSKDASSRSHYGVLRRSKLENSPKVNNEQEEKPAFRESRRELEAAQKKKKTDLDLYKNNPALKNIGRNTGEAKKSLDDEEIFYSGHDPELDEINYGSEIEILEDDIDFNIIDDQIELEENLEYESDDEFDIIQSEEMEFEEYPHVEMKAPGPPVEIKRAEPTRAEQKQQIQDEQQNNPKPETKIIQQELEIDENDNKAIKNKPQTFDKLSKEKKEEIDRLFGFSEPESDNIKIFPKQEEEESYNEVLKNLFRIQSKREQLINNISKS